MLLTLRLSIVAILSLSSFILLGQGSQEAAGNTYTHNIGVFGGKQSTYMNFARAQFNMPRAGLVYNRYDHSRGRGSMIKAAYGFQSGDQIKTFQVNDTVANAGCMFCFATMPLDAPITVDFKHYEVSYGLIRPLKRLGDQHRLLWTISVGYRHNTNKINFLDNSTGFDNVDEVSHFLLADIGAQYRFVLSDKLSVGLDAVLLNTHMGSTESRKEPMLSLTSQDFDMRLLPLMLDVWVMYGF